MKAKLFTAAYFACGIFVGGANAQTYSADTPDSVLTPDIVETERLGALRFFDGMPDDETVRKAYDNIDFSRGVEAFLSGMPAASIHAMCSGFEEAGIPAHTIGVSEDLLDARSLWLTANSTTVYVTACLDLNQGPVVMEVAPGVLGGVNDAFFRWETDVGVTGPDQGRGGRYLFLPPHYDGPVPAMGFHVIPTRTNAHWLFARAFVTEAGMDAAVANVKAGMKIYPLSEVKDPPEQTFVNFSGAKMNTIHANDATFFDELNASVQNEPADAFDPEIAGLFASIGIRKDEPFAPDERMQKILADAAAVGNATARAIVFRPRERDRFYFYPDRQWYTGFAGGSHEFLDRAARGLDDRVMFHYVATGITPAMVAPQVGAGSVYAFTPHDADGDYLDGGKTYKVTLPGPVPAKDFWSFVVYSTQHRSMLETDQRLAGLDSTLPGVTPNEDGSYTIWFGPQAPEGKEDHWVQTTPGKGYAVILRLYGPLEPWFDKTWKPGDLEEVE
ncbi:DUF1254 domain-containing protein [Hoeflea sp. WL0058]|uniref:DUF1254 domain-containing protein n=1 Tax=Flavimaribacter sediminis TaxID=2865987 RepID=A0AAE2ZQ80_9HYPH|nr:DUF1254 domain-containing protein [Flavimaribacter sediminis]MBW8640758.1 DUF1254 domain-containing protein [Flavimaribacter sediminis]